MAKRFIDTELWADPWFRKLSPINKLIWVFICTRCDNAGVWEVDKDTVVFFLGQNDFEIEEAFLEFNNGKRRVRRIESDRKWVILDFIDFQYGELSPDCPPHRSIIKLLKDYKLPYNKAKGYPSSWVQDKEKDMDKDKDKEKDKEKYDLAAPIIYLNEKAGTKYLPSARTNEDIVRARYREGRTLDDFKKVIDKKVAQWKCSEKMAPYLRPETLFNATKFESYLNEITPSAPSGLEAYMNQEPKKPQGRFIPSPRAAR